MEIKKPLYLFIISFSLLACLRVINREFSVLNAATFTLVFLLSLSVSLYALTKLINEFNLESQYLKRILAVFFFYELIIIVRGLSFDYNSIKDLLQSDYTFWVYLIPLFIFFDKRLPTLVLLTDILYYLGVFFLIACILHPSFITKRSTAEIFIHPFAFGCGFLLLNARYL